MYCKVYSEFVRGMDGQLITVEADISPGLPVFDMVGFLSGEVKEAKERVRTALKNSGYTLPPQRITVNLAPAHLRKAGSTFDLSISIAILAALGLISTKCLQFHMFVGELSLQGDILPVHGVLPMVMHAKEQGMKVCVVPFANASEASLVEGVSIVALKHLKDLIEYAKKPELYYWTKKPDPKIEEKASFLDFSDVKGQLAAKRALEIGAAGMHNVMLSGPPGAGKSMLAKRVPGILPPLTFEEGVELTKIYSVKGLLGDCKKVITKRPFRSPHHTISKYALVGGGGVPTPGELSLAHNGVLFLDEMPEFRRETLEVMRLPLETKEVVVSRVHGNYTFPANFLLLGAMNKRVMSLIQLSDKKRLEIRLFQTCNVELFAFIL